MAEAMAALVVAPGEDAVRAWARLPAGTTEAYVRFPRGGLPLAAVQRLARRGHVLVDAFPQDAEDVLDLAVAGATGIVVWLADGGDVPEMAEAMGDGLVLGCTGKEVDAAARLARELDVPLLVSGAEPPEGLRGYTIDLEAEPPVLRRFGDWPHAPAGAALQDEAAVEDAADAGDGADEENQRAPSGEL